MKELFTEYPVLENERIILRKMTMDDAEGLGDLSHNLRVYRYLPTFLFEQKYDDPREVIARMDAECFDTKESILLGVFFRPGAAAGSGAAVGSGAVAAGRSPLLGIAEIYNYEPHKAKASIGCRLNDRYWGKGIATDVVHLLRDYLTEEIGLRTITAHIMCENGASARAAEKNGFLNKYPDLYGDWGFPQLTHTNKYVYKSEWSDGVLPSVQVDQFVMAYRVEQDRIRAMLPEGFVSLRPVLRINAEIRHRDEDASAGEHNGAGGEGDASAGAAPVIYVEFNTPVEADGRRGWLNIANWKSSTGADLTYTEKPADSGAEKATVVTITAPFLTISFTGTGIGGGCPAEKDNEGCYFLGNDTEFRPAEKIDADREFCDCEFAWHFHPGDACGVSEGKSVPAFAESEVTAYERLPLTAENAAAIPCRQVLGAYRVGFRRYGK